MPLNPAIMQAAECIQQADALVIAAGAGIGVDSGLPDFRGSEGFWQAYSALAKAQLDFTQVASPRTFMIAPALAWGFYGHRLELYRRTVAHEGFTILRQWGEHKPGGYWVFTSNVDGQFQKAGFSDERIHECHGSIHWMQCMFDCSKDIWSAQSFTPEVDHARCQLRNAYPLCPHCQQLARPNILMFGDGHWNDARQDVQQQRQNQWLRYVAQDQLKLAVIEIGAGTAVPSVRFFTQQLCKNLNARLVRMNVRESAVSNQRDIALPMGALQALQEINQAMHAI